MNNMHSRRSFLGMAGIAALAAGGGVALTGCGDAGGTGTSGDSDSVTFWDMPWGTETYTAAAKELVASYDGPAIEYQTVQWTNFYQTYSTAIASKTNPAISTGGGFQPFGLAELGGIHYADAVAERLKDDYVDGLIDYVTMPDGVAGLPWQLDFTVLYHKKSVLDAHGLEAPKNWDDVYTIGETLKAEGITAFITGSGTGNDRGHQTLMSFILNNGGGLFDEEGNLDVMFDRNIEAVEFVIELVKEGFIAPESVNYTQDNMQTQWANSQGAIGFQPPNFAQRIGGEAVGDILVNSPLEGPHGDKGGLRFVNSLMMYNHNPSIENTEAFAEWYLRNIKVYWEKNVVGGIPVLKSIRESEAYTSNTELVKIAEEWGAVAKHVGSRAPGAFPDLAKIDGSSAFYTWAQACLSGGTDAKSALTQLESALQRVL